ncbi:MAG TPA: 2-amino-4-oxopentanoate thiolase subunit OrtA [Clostridia bacterium]|nr:2-amino-4-oxopentanoate thiolase subunit OrtA [Clostridia bacterium]
MILKGRWVRIHKVVLEPVDRAENLPADTGKVPYEMWVKGFLTEDAELGENVFVETITGRIVEGKLIEKEPAFNHSYGNFIPELLEIGLQLRKIVSGGENNQ